MTDGTFNEYCLQVMSTVGARLSLEAVTREMGGLYQCLATNGVEDQDTEIYAVIRLTVHCTNLMTYCLEICP